MNLHPLLGMLLVLVALGALLGGLALAQKRWSPHPEHLRKLLHIGMGIVTLSFPWVFQQAWPVWILALLSVALLFGIRWRASAAQSMHQVVHGVARESHGEIYFPLAIALLFNLSHGNPVLFCIPVLILTLADALAAIIGVHYGRVKYSTADGYKSTEGSIAFFIVTFLSVHIPLLLFTTTGRAETLLIGLLIALLVMLLEAMSWRGLDNLFIPLGSYLLLKVYLLMSTAQLSIRFLGSVLLLSIILSLRRRSTLLDSAALAAALATYIAWAAGGWQWLIPILLLYVSYTAISPRDDNNTARIHDSRAVLAVTIPALIWLFVARQQLLPELYYAYCVSLAAQLGIISLARLRFQYPQMRVELLLTRCVMQGWLIIGIPYFFISGITWGHAVLLILMGMLVTIGVTVFFYWQPAIDDCPTDTPRWWRQAITAFVVSLIAGVAMYKLPIYLGS